MPYKRAFHQNLIFPIYTLVYCKTIHTSKSTGTGSSSSGSNCVNSGTIAYQACKMAAEGETKNGQYTLSGNKCCMPDIAEPNLIPVK